MPSILSQRDARAVRNLPFCYVCGNRFSSTCNKNSDHVPPQNAFLPTDRIDFPITLPTHVECNRLFHREDEVFGQLMALPRGMEVMPDRLEIRAATDANGETYALLTNFDFHGAVRRWVTAFHCALYQEPLPPCTRFAIQTPIPSGVEIGSTTYVEPRSKNFEAIFERIQLNEGLLLTDKIQANNGALKYSCCWHQTHEAHWHGFFQLDMYAWSKLGDDYHFSARPCIGSYSNGRYLPQLATKGSSILMPWPR